MKHPDGFYYYRLETRIVSSKDPMPKHSGKEILPTDPEFRDKWALEPLRLLRIKRNQLLAATDWRFRSDLTPSQAWIDYCQALRDLPATATPALDENGNLTGVTWPTPPTE
jgi:hypothetical protein